jgi:hypothetical protein
MFAALAVTMMAGKLPRRPAPPDGTAADPVFDGDWPARKEMGV